MTMLTVKRRPNGSNTLPNVFDEFFNQNFSRSFPEAKGDFTPLVNVAETEKAFQLEFAVPGFEKKDFSINIEQEFIIISGKKETNSEKKEKNYTRKEYTYNSFNRTFTIPENVATEKIEAVYENGLLHITLPKMETKKETESKKIEIK